MFGWVVYWFWKFEIKLHIFLHFFTSILQYLIHELNQNIHPHNFINRKYVLRLNIKRTVSKVTKIRAQKRVLRVIHSNQYLTKQKMNAWSGQLYLKPYITQTFIKYFEIPFISDEIFRGYSLCIWLILKFNLKHA